MTDFVAVGSGYQNFALLDYPVGVVVMGYFVRVVVVLGNCLDCAVVAQGFAALGNYLDCPVVGCNVAVNHCSAVAVAHLDLDALGHH